MVVVVASAEIAASLVWGAFEPELQGKLRCMTHMVALSKKLVSPERHNERHGERGSDKAANDCAGVVTRRRRQLRFAVHYDSVAHYGSTLGQSSYHQGSLQVREVYDCTRTRYSRTSAEFYGCTFS